MIGLVVPAVAIAMLGFVVHLRLAQASSGVREVSRDLNGASLAIERLEYVLNKANRALGPGEDVIDLSPRLSRGAVSTVQGEPGRATLIVGMMQPTLDLAPDTHLTGDERMVIRQADLVAAHAQPAVIGGLPDNASSDARAAPIFVQDCRVDRRIRLGPNVVLKNVTLARFP